MRKKNENTEYDVLVGKRLKSVRKRLELTQEQMAEKMDITEESYRKWELGRSSLNISRLRLLYEKCGIRPDYLVLGEESMDFQQELTQFLVNCESEQEYSKRVRMLLFQIENLIVRKPTEE